MIVILIAIIITFLVILYGIFNTMINFATRSETIYLIVWFFTLLIINLIVIAVVYGYKYYKTVWSPYVGLPGTPGFTGSNGESGPSVTNYQCHSQNN